LLENRHGRRYNGSLNEFFNLISKKEDDKENDWETKLLFFEDRLYL